MALSLQRYTDKWDDACSLGVGDRNSPLFRLLTQRTKTERETSQLISITTYNGYRFPRDLFIDILSWLPVKDVLRFKSVCKEWYAIISTPQFTSKHLIKNRYNNDNCLLAHYYTSPGELLLYELLLDETPRVLEDQVLWGLEYGYELCNPCDGLYYLFAPYNRALWNPAINEFRYLPPLIIKPHPPADTRYPEHDVYGFGCDPLTGDYKVVAIKAYCSTIEDYDGDITHPLSVLVYSLRTDSWKYCGDLARSYDLDNNNCYIFVDGCCFWLSNSLRGNCFEVILSFVMADDSFQENLLPDYQHATSKSLGMYDDSLAFFSFHEDDGNFDIWTLNHGIWTKKFTVGHVPGVLKAFGQWKTNKVLVQSLDCGGRKVVLCDPNTNEIKDLEFRDYNSCQGIFTYMESLVSIKNNKKDGEDERI